MHHVTVGKRVKGLPAHTEVCSSPREGSQRCELEVIRSDAVNVGPPGQAIMGWPATAYESLILLKTGRTHQVLLHRPVSTVPLPNEMLFIIRKAQGKLLYVEVVQQCVIQHFVCYTDQGAAGSCWGTYPRGQHV